MSTTYNAVQVDETPSNVLPAGKAATALTVGMPVYLSSAGVWTKAAAVLSNLTARTDAMGFVWKDVQQYETFSPVRAIHLRGFSSLTISARMYLSATAGAITATNPGATYIQQVLGRAVSATEIVCAIENVELPLNGVTSVGAKADVAGSGVALVATTPDVSTVARTLYADDGGVALTAGDFRTDLTRMLLATAITSGDISVAGRVGQVKVVASISCGGVISGIKGILELSSAGSIGAIAGAVVGHLEVPTSAVILTGTYAACLVAYAHDLGGTHTGKAVAINIPTPGVGGTLDAFLHVTSASGATGTTYGSIDANKCLLVYYDDTLMKIPLYAVQ